MSILTDAEGSRHYCAVHAFSEPIVETEEEQDEKSTVDDESHKQSTETINDDDTSSIDDKKDEEKAADEDVDEAMFLVDNTQDVDPHQDCDYKYAPKCLVLLSRVLDFRVLKVCK